MCCSTLNCKTGWPKDGFRHKWKKAARALTSDDKSQFNPQAAEIICLRGKCNEEFTFLCLDCRPAINKKKLTF